MTKLKKNGFTTSLGRLCYVLIFLYIC